MTLSLTILILSGAGYLLAFLFYLRSFFSTEEASHRAASLSMRIAFLLATFYFAAKAVENNYFLPVTNLSEALAFFAWSLAFVYLVLLARKQSDSFGIILTPVLILLMIASGLSFYRSAEPMSLPHNPFFTVHIVSAFFAYASFAISFAAGALYLIQNHELKAKRAGTFYHKLPSLEELEKLMYQPMIWGAFLLLSAVGIGFIWSKSAYGEYWVFDPKTIATLVVVFLYFAILAFRQFSVLRPKRGAVLSLVAFMLVIFSFVLPRFIEGSHNYLK